MTGRWNSERRFHFGLAFTASSVSKDGQDFYGITEYLRNELSKKGLIILGSFIVLILGYLFWHATNSADDEIHLLTMYDKSEIDNITDEYLDELRKSIEED